MVTFTTPGSGDTQPPTVPGNLRSTGVTANSVSLAWNASTDNSGSIAGYDVYQGATKVATTGSLTATVTGLAPNTEYTFTVKARDPDGNASAREQRGDGPYGDDGGPAGFRRTTGTSRRSTSAGVSRSCRTGPRWSPSGIGSRCCG